MPDVNLDDECEDDEAEQELSTSIVNSKSVGCVQPIGSQIERTSQSFKINETNQAKNPQSNNNAEGINLSELEFAFLDNKSVCCGLCGEIVPYETLFSEHLPDAHSNILSPNFKEWLSAKLSNERRSLAGSYRLKAHLVAERVEKQPRPVARERALRAMRHGETRTVSAIRVNPRQMTVAQLNLALRRKMVEKLKRKVPVTLIDRLHAQCGLCQAIISLNKKFEIVHLVRHFNCWHPVTHPCSGSWQKFDEEKDGEVRDDDDGEDDDKRSPTSKKRKIKPLTMRDFAVIDLAENALETLQCIWCGMFVETLGLAQHFAEIHYGEVETPKCNLCVQEMVINARYMERLGIDLRVTLPDEHHSKCGLCDDKLFQSERELERHAYKFHSQNVQSPPKNSSQEQREDSGENSYSADVDEQMAGSFSPENEDDEPDKSTGCPNDAKFEEVGPEAFANSRMILGKKRRPKRQFIMPSLRQAAPFNSRFVECLADCHWKCKLCKADIYGAVISASAIKHYKKSHPDVVEDMQFEVNKARLERVSDGCMELISGSMVECLLCDHRLNLHVPYNICRAIRHLKDKHANLMPEYAGVASSTRRRPLPPTQLIRPSQTVKYVPLDATPTFDRPPMTTTIARNDRPTSTIHVSTRSQSNVVGQRRRGQQQPAPLATPPVTSVDLVGVEGQTLTTPRLEFYGSSSSSAATVANHADFNAVDLLPGTSQSSRLVNSDDLPLIMNMDDGITVMVRELRDDEDDEDGNVGVAASDFVDAGGDRVIYMAAGAVAAEEDAATKQFIMQPNNFYPTNQNQTPGLLYDGATHGAELTTTSNQNQAQFLIGHNNSVENVYYYVVDNANGVTTLIPYDGQIM